MQRIASCNTCRYSGSSVQNRTTKALYQLHVASAANVSFSTTRCFLIRATQIQLEKKGKTSNLTEAESTAAKAKSVQQENERIRQLLLDRDGGSASVPTRDGSWDQEMGRNTSKHMFRLLDQARINSPTEEERKKFRK